MAIVDYNVSDTPACRCSSVASGWESGSASFRFGEDRWPLTDQRPLFVGHVGSTSIGLRGG
jgi:hypothetical protein